MAGPENTPNPQQNTPIPDEEIARRMTGWATIGDQARQNPALAQALMVFGANMMQPVQPGDTAVGQLGRSAVAGVGAYETANYDIAKQRQDAIKQQADLEHTKAQTGYSKAQTVATESGTRRAEELHPDTKRRGAAEADRAALLTKEEEFKLTEYKAKEAAGLLSPTHFREMKELEMKKLNADIAQSNAAAGASGAAARASDASAEKVRAETAMEKLKKEVFDSFFQEELAKEAGNPNQQLARAAAMARAQERYSRSQNKSITGEASAVQVKRLEMDMIKQANPGMTPEWYAQEWLRQSTKKETIRSLENAILLADTPEEAAIFRKQLDKLRGTEGSQDGAGDKGIITTEDIAAKKAAKGAAKGAPAAATPTPADAKPQGATGSWGPDLGKYIIPGRAGVRISAPARSPFAHLDGHAYPSRAEAIAAMQSVLAKP